MARMERMAHCKKRRLKDPNRVKRVSELPTHLNFWVFVHEDRNDAHVGQEAPSPANNVLFGQPQLIGRIQAPIVHIVVVALGEELDGAVLPVKTEIGISLSGTLAREHLPLPLFALTSRAA